MATPIVAPTMRAVLSIPEAVPARAGGTAATATPLTGRGIQAKTDADNKERQLDHGLVFSGMKAIASAPKPMHAIPAAMTMRGPIGQIADQLGHDDKAERHRQQFESGDEWGRAADRLKIERRDEEKGVHAERHQAASAAEMTGWLRSDSGKNGPGVRASVQTNAAAAKAAVASKRRCPSPMRSFDRGEGEAAERDNGQDLAGQIESSAFRLSALLNCVEREKQRRRASWQAHIENASPSDTVHEPAAERRADDESKSVATRPDTHRGARSSRRG